MDVARIDLTGLDRSDGDRVGARGTLGGEAGGLPVGRDLLRELRVGAGVAHVVLARGQGPEQEERDQRRATEHREHDPPGAVLTFGAGGVGVPHDARVELHDLLEGEVTRDHVVTRVTAVLEPVGEPHELGGRTDRRGRGGGGLRTELLRQLEGTQEALLTALLGLGQVLGADGRGLGDGGGGLLDEDDSLVVRHGLGHGGELAVDGLGGVAGDRPTGLGHVDPAVVVRLVDPEHVTGDDVGLTDDGLTHPHLADFGAAVRHGDVDRRAARVGVRTGDRREELRHTELTLGGGLVALLARLRGRLGAGLGAGLGLAALGRLALLALGVQIRVLDEAARVIVTVVEPVHGTLVLRENRTTLVVLLLGLGGRFGARVRVGVGAVVHRRTRVGGAGVVRAGVGGGVGGLAGVGRGRGRVALGTHVILRKE